MANSTAKPAREKPPKPYAGFPIFAHGSGQWAKKIRGKLFYFGVWDDPNAALERLNLEFPYLKRGEVPPDVDVSGGCTLKTLANEFLKSKKEKMLADDLSPRTFRYYYKTCESLIDAFGKDRKVSNLVHPTKVTRRKTYTQRGGFAVTF